jgi:alpha-D-ribose 1-methylphosphonate 5-phosphate C-P lyase
LCGADDSYLDEIVTDDQGSRMFVCSDTDYCEGRQLAGHRGSESAAPHKEKLHG